MKMKRILMAFVTIVCLSANAAPYITNVVAKQRYPWNGFVDVSYEVVGTTNGINHAYGRLEAIDRKTQKTYVASTFVKPLDLTEGEHAAIWDMSADHSIVSEAMVFQLSIQTPALYRVINVAEGPGATSYPVQGLDDVPANGWGAEYKTDKIVLRRIEGENGIYYAGIFEITEAQWDKVMGGTSTSMKPKSVSYNSIRGNVDNYNWPSSDAVDTTSFMGKLRQKTGLTTLDLPSEDEWKFAARAGVTTKWLCGDSETGLKNYAWYSTNSDNATHEVGTLRPNGWGLYDVHGNVLEWCLNPVYDSSRVLRGGAYNYDASSCAFDYRIVNGPSRGSSFDGFRLFCRPGSN